MNDKIVLSLHSMDLYTPHVGFFEREREQQQTIVFSGPGEQARLSRGNFCCYENEILKLA